MQFYSGDTFTINDTTEIIVSIKNYDSFYKLNFDNDKSIILLKDDTISSNIAIVIPSKNAPNGYEYALLITDLFVENIIYLNYYSVHNMDKIVKLANSQIKENEVYWFRNYVPC